MKYELDGNFHQIAEKAIELNKYMEDKIFMEDGKIFIHDSSNYSLALEILLRNKLISKNEYEKSKGKLINCINEEYQMKMLEFENYKFLVDSNSVTICDESGNKCLSVVKIPNELFNNYFVVANDFNADQKNVDERKIPFMIRKNSPIYEIINSFYINRKSNLILSRNKDKSKNHIKIENDGFDNYVLTVVKKNSDLEYSDNVNAVIHIGDAFDNDNWMTIDSIYNNLQIRNRVQKVLKKKKI